MSGGVVGPIGMTGGIGVAAIGAAVVIGATAKAAVDITKMGSIAAYEQMKLATACTAAVNNAKTQRKQAVISYQNESRSALQRLNNSVDAEILRLKSKLESNGHSVDLRRFGLDQNAVLLGLITMDQSFSGVNVHTRLRIPSEIYRSITAQIDPLFAFIPEKDSAFSELVGLKDRANRIVNAHSMTATEKSSVLIKIESELISRMEAYRTCSKKYEYYLAQFASLSFANEKLAEACGINKLDLIYDPYRAGDQIAQLSKANADLRRKLRERIKEDKSFIAANRELARRVMVSIQEAGFKRMKVAEQEYGISALYIYRDSLLSVTVSKEGVLSMDLVGKNGESTQQIKADEQIFCSTDLKSIYRAFERNGLSMQIDRICNLTADSILCEDDIDMHGTKDDRWIEDAPLAMYVDSNWGGQ